MLDGYKTYLTAIAAFLVALGYFILNWVDNGTVEPQALITAFIALAIVFLRKGVNKT